MLAVAALCLLNHQLQKKTLFLIACYSDQIIVKTYIQSLVKLPSHFVFKYWEFWKGLALKKIDPTEFQYLIKMEAYPRIL